MNDLRSSTITFKGQIVIPNDVRARDGFKSGQKVAILDFQDHLEIRPLKSVLEKIDFKEANKKTRKALKEFVERHKLKGIKIGTLSRKEKDALARASLGQTLRE